MINPVLAEMAVYPFTRLEEERRRLLAAGVDVIDFGKGDPNEPTDPMIRTALVEALPERAPYPLAQGLPELCESAAGWIERRFGVSVDPETEIVLYCRGGQRSALTKSESTRNRRCETDDAGPGC